MGKFGKDYGSTSALHADPQNVFEGFSIPGKPGKDFCQVAGFPEKLEKIIFVLPGSAGVGKTFLPDFLVSREVEFNFC